MESNTLKEKYSWRQFAPSCKWCKNFKVTDERPMAFCIHGDGEIDTFTGSICQKYDEK